MKNTETTTKSNKMKFILPLIILIGLVYGVMKYMHSQLHETTDDAQVQKNMSPIIPKVSGYIKKIYVKDNNFVKKGDTLFVIDNSDYLVKLEDAKAGLLAAESSFEVSKSEIGTANANVSVSNANISSANGSIETAKIRLGRASADFERYNNLYKNHSITKQQFEQSLATKQEAESQLNILKDQQKASEYQKNALQTKTIVSGKQTQVASANIARAKSMLNAAKLNIDYTIVTAMTDGQVSRIDIQPGQLVQAGQSLFYLINNDEVWVIANFKETQLNKMKIGQTVNLKIDAFQDVEFIGELASFSPATGSQFSILPPDNATGNFVKTVQRIPVKIVFTDKNKKDKLQLLRSGMNVEVDVTVAQ
ncbi:MAG: HlyD family secretion protein [Flavobacterium sp.]|nr:HlyD family secretion protein [Flavobacterium sp.]